MKQSFDKHHKAHQLPQLSPDTEVWIPQIGSVISSPSHRSYWVKTPTHTIRRNRRRLNPIPLRETQQQTAQVPCESVPQHPAEETATSVREPEIEQQPSQSKGQARETAVPGTGVPLGATVLRSGRIIHPPQKLGAHFFDLHQLIRWSRWRYSG